MTGGRAYLFDPDGRHLAALDGASVAGTRLSTIVGERADGPDRAAEFERLMRAHRGAGSQLAATLLEDPDLASSIWVVEPIAPVAAVLAPDDAGVGASAQPDRNLIVPESAPTS
jgi:hypothetical protein